MVTLTQLASALSSWEIVFSNKINNQEKTKRNKIQKGKIKNGVLKDKI